MILTTMNHMKKDGKWDANIAATVRNSVDTQRGRYKAIKSQALKKAQTTYVL